MDEQGSSGASETRLPNRHFSFSLLAFNPISKQFISIDRRNKGGLEGVSCPAFNYFLIIVLQNHADELQELVLETIFEKFISRKALNLILYGLSIFYIFSCRVVDDFFVDIEKVEVVAHHKHNPSAIGILLRWIIGLAHVSQESKVTTSI